MCVYTREVRRGIPHPNLKSFLPANLRKTKLSNVTNTAALVHSFECNSKYVGAFNASKHEGALTAPRRCCTGKQTFFD